MQVLLDKGGGKFLSELNSLLKSKTPLHLSAEFKQEIGNELEKMAARAEGTAEKAEIKELQQTLKESEHAIPGTTPGQWVDVGESMSPRAAAYQTQITGRPAGEVYRVNGVKFDGFDGTNLIDAKGPGYANFVKDGKFQEFFRGEQSLIDQARHQIIAAKGTPIIWHVAEPEAAAAIQRLFNTRNITVIKIIVTPAMP